jgi:hypothetical protein
MSKQDTIDKGTDASVMTLDQLTQSIEMMTSVVNRLKRHLQLQLASGAGEDVPESLQRDLLASERELLSMQQLACSLDTAAMASHDSAHPGLVLEISLLEDDIEPPQVRVLH